MSYRRTKTLTFDNAEFIISSLTVDQVEEYLAPLENMAANALITVKNRTYKIVCHALNNVHADEDGNLPEDYKPWTIERLRKVADLVTVDKLNKEVLEFSGLKIMTAAQGEPKAASVENPEPPATTVM